MATYPPWLVELLVSTGQRLSAQYFLALTPSPTETIFGQTFFFNNNFCREEEELLSGAPDEFLCPIMSILMTDPMSFIFMCVFDLMTPESVTDDHPRYYLPLQKKGSFMHILLY